MSIDTSNLLIESEKPLSKSLIWKMQSDFYAQQGPKAWSEGIVPQYITTNPYIANLYAKTVFAYCKDYTDREDYSPDSTLYILELAAGIGRFTYTFLKRFTTMLQNSPLSEFKFKYVITDFAEGNVTYWQEHPSLKPFFENGQLDCATFDMIQDNSIRLRHCGETISPSSMSQPLFVFANYTFDSLPQDSFYVKDGELYEGLLTLSKKRDQNTALRSTSILADISYEYSDRKIDGSCYYSDPIFNDLLTQYQTLLDDSAFTLPIVAFRCLSRLIALFGDDLLLLTADKGYKDLYALQGTYHPVLSEHGSISLMVNFHALELFFERLGGITLHSMYDHEHVTLSLFVFTKKEHPLTETHFVFEEIADGIGPDDFHALKKAFIPHQKTMSTKELMTFLRYTLWDSRTFLELYNTLLERISEEENFPVDEFITALYKVWAHYFPIGEEGDLSYCLGTLFAYFGYDYEAIELFETSALFYGETPAILYEIALGYYNLQEFEVSMNYLDKSLALDAEFEESLNLKGVIESNS